MKIIIKRTNLKFSQKAFTESAQRKLSRFWKDSIQAFITAIIDADVIQIDSGMSKASLIPLARRVQLGQVVEASLTGIGNPRKGYTDAAGGYHPKTKKTKSLGMTLGQEAYTIKYGTVSDMRFLFAFQIVIYQYVLHENGFQTKAWNSLPIGERAFIDFIESNKRDPKYLPLLADGFKRGK